MGAAVVLAPFPASHARRIAATGLRRRLSPLAGLLLAVDQLHLAFLPWRKCRTAAI